MSRSGARLMRLAPIFASAFDSVRRDPAAHDPLAGPIRIGVRGPAALARRDERFAAFSDLRRSVFAQIMSGARGCLSRKRSVCQIRTTISSVVRRSASVSG
jgi:hypothetical protein